VGNTEEPEFNTMEWIRFWEIHSEKYPVVPPDFVNGPMNDTQIVISNEWYTKNSNSQLDWQSIESGADNVPILIQMALEWNANQVASLSSSPSQSSSSSLSKNVASKNSEQKPGKKERKP
jgi:hypothetical protein